MKTTMTVLGAAAVALAACAGNAENDTVVAEDEAVHDPTTPANEATTTTAAPTPATNDTAATDQPSETTTTGTPETTNTTEVLDSLPTDEPASPVATARPSADGVTLFGADMSQPNAGEIAAFLQDPDDDGGPFYMVNMIRYRDEAEYPDGRETDLTGEEADAIYGQFMATTMLPRYGAEVMFTADVERDLIGGSAWDGLAVVKYASRAAFAEMSQDQEFQDMAIHKAAGVLDTVVLATSLIETPQLPPVENPPFPATDDDTVMAFMHVLDYRETAEYQPGDADADPDRTGRDAVALYSENAGSVAGSLGIRPAAWFEVEATALGPVGVWDEVRINVFPSHAAFDALTADPTWRSGTHHRAAGLEQTFAIMNQPAINRFNGMVADLD